MLDQTANAPTLASAMNIGAFTLGNALATWLGGLVLGAGFGATSPNMAGAGPALGDLALAVTSALLERRGPRGAAPAPRTGLPVREAGAPAGGGAAEPGPAYAGTGPSTGAVRAAPGGPSADSLPSAGRARCPAPPSGRR